MTADANKYLKELDVYHKLFDDKEPEDCEYTESDIILFAQEYAEAYLKQKVSEITDLTDDEIFDIVKTNGSAQKGIDAMTKKYGVELFVKWFKEKLLNSK